MKLGIMQPYLFPYLGYWQLIDCVDQFVIMEDLNYIKQGFVNRNYILIRGNAHRFTLELVGASQNKLINEIEIGHNRDKILKTIEVNYRYTPHFTDAFPVIESVFDCPESNLASFITNSIVKVCDYLGIGAQLIRSPDIERNLNFKSQDMVLDICKRLGAKQYINAIGGSKLYCKNAFKEHGIDLYFLKMKPFEYNQFNINFVPNLSIIDVMMFNSRTEIKNLLCQFELI